MSDFQTLALIRAEVREELQQGLDYGVITAPCPCCEGVVCFEVRWPMDTGEPRYTVRISCEDGCGWKINL